MINDDLYAIETYLEELEALRNYPQVKEERDTLTGEMTKLKEKVGQLTTQLASETSGRKKTLSQLRKNQSEAEDLRRNLDKAKDELTLLKDFKAKLPAGTELSLEKTKEEFLKAEAKEIDAKTKERVEEREKELQSRMPILVQEELQRVLNGPNWPPEIEKVVVSQARRLAEEMLRDAQKWPEWFKNYYLQHVQEAVATGLTPEFDRRVQIETQRQLEAMKKGQWERYSTAKASQLSANLKAMVNQLQGRWQFPCDRYKRMIPIQVGPFEIGQLLGEKMVEVTCSACFDFVAFPFPVNVPHKVASFNLPTLVQLYLGGTPPG